MKSYLLILILCCSSVGFADDLLSILEESTAESAKTVSIIEERTELSRAVRQLIKLPTAEQNIFLSFLDKNQFEKGLLQWRAAFGQKGFAKTDNGQALYAYLLFKNNLPIVGIEHLFQIKQPSQIHHQIKRTWVTAAPATHPAWGQVKVHWQPAWTLVFDVATEIKVIARQDIELEKEDYILSLLKKTKEGTNERAWLEWQMALSLAVNKKVSKAAKVLAHLLKQKNEIVSENLINVTVARLLYERGFLDAALKYYEKVTKDSEYWFVAQEEMAWTFMRKGQTQNSLAITKTLMTKEFAPHIGPEILFLNSLAQLKVCDYPGVAKSIIEFRQRFRPRVVALKELSLESEAKAAKKLLSLLKDRRIRLIEMGPEAASLPRYVSRDETLFSYAQAYWALVLEAERSGELYARSLNQGTDKVGFQAEIEELKVLVESRVQEARSAAFNLIKKRAQQEVAEISMILQKMHIVEAELIQQTNMASRVIAASKKANIDTDKSSSDKTGKYDLKFPFVGEKWFDELSNYRVDISKACKARRAAR